MNTIKKYFMVIAVAVIAISASAYKSIEMAEGANLDEVIFYHSGNGMYNRDQPSSVACQEDQSSHCTITYLNASDVEGIEDFLDTSLPAGNHTKSSNTGLWP